MHYAATYYDGILPHIGNCAGTETAALFGCGLLTSYLGLFINFYFQTYKGRSKSRKPTTNGKAAVGNGHANGNAFVFFLSIYCFDKFPNHLWVRPKIE